jgi:hypothetical protein
VGTQSIAVFDACGEAGADDRTAFGSSRSTPTERIRNISMLIWVGCGEM